jgi:hypothetical protein
MLAAMPRIIAFLLAGAAVLASCRAENAKREIDLLAGKDLSALEYVTKPATDIATVCHFTDDGALAIVGKPIGFLATKATYHNYRLHAEWRWPADAAKNSNSGVLLHIASGPKDRAWPLCFQLQTKPTRAGDLLPMAGASFAEKLSTAPGAKTPQLDRQAESSDKPLGEWNACDVVCRDGAIEVTINGVRQNKVTRAVPDSGKIGFQLEGTPYDLRNVRVEPLD